MQDFVAVRVANAREEPRVGQGALERVVFAAQYSGERRPAGLQGLQSAGVERA